MLSLVTYPLHLGRRSIKHAHSLVDDTLERGRSRPSLFDNLIRFVMVVGSVSRGVGLRVHALSSFARRGLIGIVEDHARMPGLLVQRV